MKYTELEKANEINRQIKTLQDLRRICLKPYLTIWPINRSLAFKDDYGNIIINEKGLNDVIIEYCDKRIKELQKEIEEL